MRALLENDRQLEGCFTTYNNALERPALKKGRFLNGASEPPRAPAAAPPNGEPVEPGPPSAGSLPAAPVAEHPLFAPPSDSPFADKLKQALHSAGPEQKS